MTVAAVESAWNTNIWQSATIQAITTNILTFEHTEESEFELEGLFYNQEINFIEAVTSRSLTIDKIGDSNPTERYLVEVRYTKAADTTGANYGLVKSFFDTLCDLVSAWTNNWSSTVDYFQYQEGPAAISTDSISDIPVVRGVYRFTGFKA